MGHVDAESCTIGVTTHEGKVASGRTERSVNPLEPSRVFAGFEAPVPKTE